MHLSVTYLPSNNKFLNYLEIPFIRFLVFLQTMRKTKQSEKKQLLFSNFYFKDVKMLMLKDMCYTITQPVGNCWPRWNPPMFLKALGPLTLLELLSIFNKLFPFLESGISLLSSQFLELASQPAM